MIDYVSVLSRAVAALDPNTSEQRRVLYDRARNMLAERLRDPAAPQAALRAESAALETAIRRVENEAQRRVAPPQPDDAVDETADGYRDMPPLKEPRRPLRIVAGAVTVLAVLAAGAASYALWPSVLSAARNMVAPRDVITVVADEPDDKSTFVRMRQLVYYRSNQPVGTIVVDKSQTFLYVVRPNVSALRYSIGVGSECNALAGLYHIVRKEELPATNKPLGQVDAASLPGVRALYLEKDYRIYGSNASAAPGQQLPEGCFRLVYDDVIYLYDRTPLESRVVVSN